MSRALWHTNIVGGLLVNSAMEGIRRSKGEAESWDINALGKNAIRCAAIGPASDGKGR